MRADLLSGTSELLAAYDASEVRRLLRLCASCDQVLALAPLVSTPADVSTFSEVILSSRVYRTSSAVLQPHMYSAVHDVNVRAMQSASRLLARVERDVGDRADDLLDAAERGELRRELETLHADWPVLHELVRLRADMAAVSPAGMSLSVSLLVCVSVHVSGCVSLHSFPMFRAFHSLHYTALHCSSAISWHTYQMSQSERITKSKSRKEYTVMSCPCLFANRIECPFNQRSFKLTSASALSPESASGSSRPRKSSCLSALHIYIIHY